MDVITRIVRTRNIGQAIVDEAERRRSRDHRARAPATAHKPGQRLFGPTVDYVLRNAHCRVMVGAEPARALMLQRQPRPRLVFLVLGVALLVRDASSTGGGQVGFLAAAVFLLLGAACALRG